MSDMGDGGIDNGGTAEGADEASLDEHIALLYRLHAHADESDDPAGLMAELGRSLLERHQRDSDDESFEEGVAWSRQALDQELGHDDRGDLLFALGLGFMLRGDSRRSVDDFDAAIGYLSTYQSEHSIDEPGSDPAALLRPGDEAILLAHRVVEHRPIVRSGAASATQ